MVYEYSGYLRTVLGAPDPAEFRDLESVEFTADEIARWGFQDLPGDLEWQHIPVNSKRTEHGVRIEGRFNDIRQIDNLAADDPSFWVPLSSLNVQDPRFPIDARRYPIVELTYRCASSNARPAWLWTYPGGQSFDGLAPVQEWRTIARLVQCYDFPSQINAVILRLYSISRTVEAFEVQSVRFRAMSPSESQVCERLEATLREQGEPRKYKILDEFMPAGTYMDAGSSKRLAAMLGISLNEYWELVFEDIARHNHNTVALERIDRLTSDEWNNLLKLAEKFQIKFFAIYNLPLGTPQTYFQEFVDTHIKPYADSPSILAWSLHDEPPEHGFQNLLQARPYMEQADPNHPLAVILREPNAFPLFARFFPASGIAQYRSHAPWQVAEMVRTHRPLSTGQQFWFVAPGFIYATDTPEWHSCPEMRLMLNLSYANGARGWFTFAYHNDPIWIRGSCQRSLTGPFLTFSDLWAELSQRLEQYNALAPLFLQAVPEPGPEPWFASKSTAHANAQLPEGIPPSSVYRLSGPDFQLHCVVSNDVREMTTVNLDISAPAVDGMALFDLSDFVYTRRWLPMAPRRHMEMFPGQLHIILSAPPEVCERWRDVISERIILNDRRQLLFDLPLASAYGLNIEAVEAMVESAAGLPGTEALHIMEQARESVLNVLYQSSSPSLSRSKLIEVSAAICACDGTLCRLLGQGKSDQARQLGFKVIPLARELTHLRLELRRGRGAAILEHCQSLAQRTAEVLAEIRAVP